MSDCASVPSETDENGFSVINIDHQLTPNDLALVFRRWLSDHSDEASLSVFDEMIGKMVPLNSDSEDLKDFNQEILVNAVYATALNAVLVSAIQESLEKEGFLSNFDSGE